MRVLLADDHFLVLEGLEVLLSTFSFVECTKSVQDFFELKKALEDEIFDILLLDINFGRHDGREILPDIKGAERRRASPRLQSILSSV